MKKHPPVCPVCDPDRIRACAKCSAAAIPAETFWPRVRGRVRDSGTDGRTVEPLFWTCPQGTTFGMMFGIGPRVTITCGDCEGTFRKRAPLVTRPGIECSYCGAINVLPVQVDWT